jgi:regulator of sigma E protease
MDNILFSLLFFLLALGVLITVHEFGHFWVARMLGVKVVRFSIGFGRPLLTWRRGPDQTEYAISALPLGGYVKMLDESEMSVPTGEAHRAFNRQRLPKRFAIVFAGPFFNFLFAIVAYWLMFVAGVTGVKPLVGDVESGSPAYAAGLRAGDEIVTVEDEPTPTWEAAILAMLPKVLDREPITLSVQAGGQAGGQVGRRVTLDLDAVELHVEQGNVLQELGIRPFRPDIPPVIGKVISGGAAARAGLKPGDKVLSANGTPIRDWEEWVRYVRQHPEQALDVEVQRGDEIVHLIVRPDRVAAGKGETIGQIGASVDTSVPVDNSHIGVMRYGPVQALAMGLDKTWDMTALTLQLLVKMVFGQASWENISGPISIAQYAGEAASIGLSTFLAFLAIISVSLGVLNLLPIPVLDGGHLLYYAIEFVKGSPLSEHAQAIGQRIGIALLLALMSIAFYNDLARLFS